jgi:acyl-CoA reductase-like NAD-dependent aldehyde dehydrogenase
VLAEAGFEIDTAPMVAAVLGSMAEAALAPEQIDPQAPYPRLHREPYGVAALVIPFNWPLAVMMTKLTSALTAGKRRSSSYRRRFRSRRCSSGRRSPQRCRRVW